MRRIHLAVLLPCLLVMIGAAPAGAEATEFTLGQGTQASALTTGREGNLWFAGTHHGSSGSNDVVGRVSPSGEVTEYPLPERPESELGIASIIAARDGFLYVTETGAGRIGRMSTSGQFEDFPLPTAGSLPRSIVEAPDGKLWVAEQGLDAVVSLDNGTNILSEYRLNPGSRPSAVAVRADGTVWVTKSGFAELGSISPDGTTRSFELRDPRSRPNQIVTGPEGNLWFTDQAKSRLGRITSVVGTTGEYEWIDLPWGSSTGLITFGPHGDFWYTVGNKIGSVSATWGLAEPSCVSGGCNLSVTALTAGPDGELWYATGATIGRFEPAPIRLVIGASASLSGRFVSLRMDCGGGYAGQICDGKVTLLGRLPVPGGGTDVARLGRVAVRFRPVAARRIRIRLSPKAAAALRRDGRLRVRVAATVKGGRPSGRTLVLHAPGRKPVKHAP
jgi:virginiamycin B lyase